MWGGIFPTSRTVPFETWVGDLHPPPTQRLRLEKLEKITQGGVWNLILQPLGARNKPPSPPPPLRLSSHHLAACGLRESQ